MKMATIVFDMATKNAISNPLTGQPSRNHNANTRAVTGELMNVARARVEMRDPTSSKLNIKGPVAADALRKQDMKLWNHQMKSIPEIMFETARQNRLIDQDVRTRDLQEFQFYMVRKIEGDLRQSLRDAGHDISKFRIGGHDRGTYERFYKVEPRRYMTKPQFFTAIRRAFGDELIKSQAALGKLYDSYDPDHHDEMDWRAFLFLLTIFMQPQDDVFTHLRWAFAIYSSIGTLDYEGCPESLSIGEIKDMIVVPTLMRFRKDIKQVVEDAWLELSAKDLGAQEISESNGDKGIDSIRVSYTMFEKLLKDTRVSELLAVRQTFGRRDPRPWLYSLEVDFYHYSLTEIMTKLRREIRDEAEVVAFIARVEERIIRRHFHRITAFVLRRAKIRKMILLCSVRWKNENVASSFDRWRRTVLVNSLIKQVQRIVRGFIARKRARFMKRMQVRVVRVQAGVRSIRRRIEFNQFNRKRTWAAKIIQKNVRGRQARIKVVSRIEAMYDLGVRNVEKARKAYYEERRERAVWKVQMAARRFLVRCHIVYRVENRIRLEALAAKMDMEKEKARIEKELYRKELEEWYVKRKEENDLTVMQEGATSDARKKIVAFRNRQREIERLEREARREEMMEKQEEQRIEIWIQKWEEAIVRRVEEKGKQCYNCLLMPETPEDIILAKDLKERIKKHVKVVLRRADKQKIPMEIPEAQELAKKEIIDLEMEAERQRAKDDMRAEATQGQAELEEKHARDWAKQLAAKDRKRDWGIYLVVAFFRMVVARKKLRAKAYDRYEKHFDVPSVSYFYKDKRTSKTFWAKPKSLDAYDIKGDDGWVVLFDKNDDMYFYQPSTWKMQWDPPFGSAICMKCDRQFAIVRVTENKKFFCENCFNDEVKEMLVNMTPQEVRFKPFKGNRDGAASTIFSYIKETNWWKYMLETDPSLAKSQEQDAHAAKMSDRKKGILGEACGRCKEKGAARICDQCQEYFCVECYDKKHAADTPWSSHSFQIYEQPKRRGAKEKMEEKKKKLKDAIAAAKSFRKSAKSTTAEVATGKGAKPKKGKKGRKGESESEGGESRGRSRSPSSKKKKMSMKDAAGKVKAANALKKGSSKSKSPSGAKSQSPSAKSKSPGPKKKDKDPGAKDSSKSRSPSNGSKKKAPSLKDAAGKVKAANALKKGASKSKSPSAKKKKQEEGSGDGEGKSEEDAEDGKKKEKDQQRKEALEKKRREKAAADDSSEKKPKPKSTKKKKKIEEEAPEEEEKEKERGAGAKEKEEGDPKNKGLVESKEVTFAE